MSKQPMLRPEPWIRRSRATRVAHRALGVAVMVVASAVVPNAHALPHLSVTPSSIQIAVPGPGQNAFAEFTVTNVSGVSQTLVYGSASIPNLQPEVGSFSPGFSDASIPCSLGVPIPAAGTCRVRVTFYALAPGATASTLSLVLATESLGNETFALGVVANVAFVPATPIPAWPPWAPLVLGVAIALAAARRIRRRVLRPTRR